MRVDDAQLLCLSEKARTNGAITGVLMKKSGEPRIQRWQRRYCCIYRNILFYFESERSAKPSGVVFLEHCTCLVVPTADEKVCLHRRVPVLSRRACPAHTCMLAPCIGCDNWPTCIYTIQNIVCTSRALVQMH